MPNHPDPSDPDLSDAQAEPVEAQGELDDTRDQLADALSEVERLQLAAADAEAARTELLEARAELTTAHAELVDLSAQLAEVRTLAESLQGQLRDAALKYRDARLAAHPQIPPDLVPGDTIADIDQQFESALNVVSHLRDQLQSQSQAARMPTGAPARRAPDLSALTPAEKIKLGLQERSRQRQT